ncbi:MAG: YggS family pyridoxal phosphate-dependent enzyme [Phycisphaerae bacterium]|nr:YggS family pyridoxal phosphate-dependent enzyme [Phycisphaerae bacterium]
MPTTANRIAKNLSRIRQEISDACQRVGRSPDSVEIVAVTKSVDIPAIKNCLKAGLVNLGESRPQQLAERFGQLDEYLHQRHDALQNEVKWHMVGHLQRNKVKQALTAADVIHSVDSLRLAEEISTRAEADERVVDIMLQVNCSQEDQKFGCAVGAATHLGEMICSMRSVRLTGLMTMGPVSEDPEQTRRAFIRLREIFEEMKHDKIGGDGFAHLSMGMSGDYAIAVEEGATIVRIGTALFG